MAHFFWRTFLLAGLTICLSKCSNQPQSTPADVQVSKLPKPTLAFSDSLLRRAFRLRDQRNADSSIYWLREAIRVKKELGVPDSSLIKIYLEVAMLHNSRSRFALADKYVEEARRIAESADTSLTTMGPIFRTMAVTKRELKDYTTATSVLERYLRMLDQATDVNKKQEQVKAKHLLANVYFEKGEYAKAIDIWNIALSTAEKNDSLGRRATYFNQALAYQALENYQQAVWCFDRSLALSGNDLPNRANVLLSKAFVSLALNQRDQARDLIQQALAIRERVFGRKDINTWGALYGLGLFYERVNSPDSSLFYYQKGLISLIPEFNNGNIAHNPAPTQDEMSFELVMTLVNKARILHSMARRGHSPDSVRKVALKTYFLADSVLRVYRTNFMFDDPVLQQLGARTIPYHEMLELIHLQLVNGDNDLYFEEALEVMENSRSAILNESLNRALTLSSSDVPEYKRKKERNLVRLRAELLQQINKVGENSDKRDSLNKVLINVSNQYNDLLNDLESVDRSKLVLRGNSGTASLEDVRSLTKQRDALLLEYFWADSSIYVLGISPSGKAFKKIAVTEELKSGLLSFQTSIANNPGEATRREEFGEFLKCSTALYKILVEPFLEMNPSVRTLIISADGALTNIPFEAMVSEMVDTAEVNYKLPYLINRYTLSYSYSTHTLLRQAKVPRQGGRLLAMAYGGRGEEDTLRSALGNLPGTETELRALQAVMPGGDNSYLFGSDATEANFKRLIPGFDIVHLAVHGLAERKNAYDSRLLFRSATDTVDDGALYAHELYDLDLRDLDLAVLSACESGVGTYQTGEGTRSIAHGFAYAGCPSLVMSLWKIDDRTTAGLVKDMYLELLDENEIDVVLMNIKKRYIENANEFKSHPYFWAALVQVGDSRPVEVGASLYRGWIIAAFLIGFLLLYALYRHYGRT